MTTNVGNYDFLKCQRWMLAFTSFRNAGDKCCQIENPEMLATNVSNYDFHKWWPYLLANIVFRNASDEC